jgi:hypothetical protein
VEKYGRTRQGTDDNMAMRIVCWITEATNINSEYVIFITFSLKQWLHERSSKLRYTYVACLKRNMVPTL